MFGIVPAADVARVHALVRMLELRDSQNVVEQIVVWMFEEHLRSGADVVVLKVWREEESQS